MILKNKKILCVCIFVSILICLSCRIWWVNKNARIPEIEIFRQGETVEYNGVGYTIENATMMEYNAFFEKYPEYKSYYNSSDYGRRMLLVECVADKLSDEGEFDSYLPIRYEYVFNGIDPFMFRDMNPDLVEGTFKSGDTVLFVYEIYEENLTKEQWDNVDELDYYIVYGTYPKRTEVLLTDINEGD